MNYPQRPTTPTKHEFKVTQKGSDGKWSTIGYADTKEGSTGKFISVGINRGGAGQPSWENFIITRNEERPPPRGPRQNASAPVQPNYTQQAPPANWPPPANRNDDSFGI